MAETPLYGRKYRLLLAHPIVGDFARAQPNAIEVTDLRISFKITKTLTKEPNTAEITITNLSRLMRQALSVKDLRVILEAGYEGKMSGIFQGDARTLDHKREGRDWNTVIKCGEAERATALARVNLSFKTGTPLDGIMDKITSGMSLPFGPEARSLFAGKQAVSGHAAHGPAVDELDRVVSAAGLEWSIQDGKLQILRPDSATTEEAVELSAASGLIGSPEHSAPDKKTGKIIVKGSSLLQPRIRPGGRVVLNAEALKGTFRVIKVEHVGDSRGADWTTNFEVQA